MEREVVAWDVHIFSVITAPGIFGKFLILFCLSLTRSFGSQLIEKFVHSKQASQNLVDHGFQDRSDFLVLLGKLIRVPYFDFRVLERSDGSGADLNAFV